MSMSMSRPLSNESGIKVPNIISWDLHEKKSDPIKLKETVPLSSISSFKKAQNNNSNLNSNQNQNYNYTNLLISNSNLNKNSSNIPNIKQFKFSASSSKTLNNNNDYINNNNKNFIYFCKSNSNFNYNNNDNYPSNNGKRDSFPLISNFNCAKESNEIGYLKNIRNEEKKLRKLINKRKQNRIELINNHHFETLRENLKNTSNGLYLTSLIKEKPKEELNFNPNTNTILLKNSTLDLQKNENLFQSYIQNSNHRQRHLEDPADKSNSKMNSHNDTNIIRNENVIRENLNENNNDTDLDEKNDHSKIKKLFRNEAITKNLINNTDNVNNSKIIEEHKDNNSNENQGKVQEKKDSFEEILEKERNAPVLKKNSLKELRKINQYFITKVLKKKNHNGAVKNNSFSYKDINEEYEGVTEREAEKLRLENYDLSLLSKEESSINRNKVMRIRNTLLFQQLKLSENEIVPLAFLNSNNTNETIIKNIFTMKLAKKRYLQEEKKDAYANKNKTNSNNNDSENIKSNENNEMNICSSENIDGDNANEHKQLRKQSTGLNYRSFLIPSSNKDQKTTELRKEKKRYLVQILNNSDDEDNRVSEVKRLKVKENQRLLRPSLSLFKNTLYQMKNEVNYSQDLDEFENGLSPYEKLLLKINSLFKDKFEDKGKFINKIKETFMIENQLKIKEEHTKQIDEFYETKLGSLKDSIKSIKSAEDLFSNRYLVKFYDYLRHVNLLNEMEKQNLNKLKQNKNELDIEIIKLNSNIYKIRDKLSVYTEYRNFMICVKERSIEPPTFFADKMHTQEELKKKAGRRLIVIEKKINLKRNEIAKLESALKAEIEKKSHKSSSIKKFGIPHQRASGLNLTQYTRNSSIKVTHAVANSASNNNNNINTHKEINNNSNLKGNTNNINDNISNNYFQSSKNVAASTINSDSTTELNTNSISVNLNNNNLNSSIKRLSSEKVISKNDPNYERIMLENKIAEEHSNLDALLKEKDEYSRYFNYLTEPIFKTFDDFYSELKKLEKDNITFLNKMNENSIIVQRMKMELYEMRAEDERTVKKYQNDLDTAQAKSNEVRLHNKELKDKLNRLIISMRKQTKTNSKKHKSSGVAHNKSSSQANINLLNNFNSNYISTNNSDLNALTDRNSVNPLSKSISGSFAPDNGSTPYIDFERAESSRNSRKPGYFNSIFNTFNLVNEIKKFEKTETLKVVPYEEQALIMLKHIENNVNLLLHRHENYKGNPQTKSKLIAVTNAIDKENRAKKCAERMKQVLENHKNMIERVNYKFNRLNVLPKRKCAPRFRPKDSVNPSGVLSSVNFNKNVDDEEHDFLDII